MDILEKIKEINLLRPQKDDIIIVKVPSQVSYTEMGHIEKYIQELLNEIGFNNKILVCYNDLDFSIVRKEE